ncbi:MAG: Nucleotide-binding protein implicated in inhibition of septum formation [candidate division TM6 bacterium GW2011_GWE2_42_60]|nr:MAG: Nucleotide-binding protein implicated in inhibition of septum formation [candidate division TM6 bacterium GW2011_GWE2_42_60]HBY06140.1 hypothetical protein [Candidatus Dependentiae bacterium]
MFPLLLASSSPTRQKLLRDAGIPFIQVAHSYEEPIVNAHLISDLEGFTLSLAAHKVGAINLAAAAELFSVDRLFVLAADTLVATSDNLTMGKPRSYEEAVEMLRALSCKPVFVVTSYVCRAYVRRVSGDWECEQESSASVRSRVLLDLPEVWIPWYLSVHKDFLLTAGALEVEGVGALFVKSIEGCYSSVLGLPMNSLRSSLESIGFFKPLF